MSVKGSSAASPAYARATKLSIYPHAVAHFFLISAQLHLLLVRLENSRRGSRSFKSCVKHPYRMAKYRKQPQSARRRAYIRSCLPACCTFLVFSTLLTSLGLLAHFHSPAAKQRIGWQSWDLVIKEHKDGDGAGEGGLSLPLDVWVSISPGPLVCALLH